MIPSDAEVVPVEGVYRTGASTSSTPRLGQPPRLSVTLDDVQATGRRSKAKQLWLLEQQVESAAEWYSVWSMKE
jgi:hypothetical protein